MAVVAREVSNIRERVRKCIGKDDRRLGVHRRRPADAMVDRRALKEDGLRSVEGLVAVEDEQAQAAAVRVDDGHEPIRRDGNEPV